ncbi:MAG: nucleotidyltransferase domain-containing protein [Thermoplasmata archaeon]
MNKRNPLMVDSITYTNLNAYRSYLQKEWERKVTFNETIAELLHAPSFFVKLNESILNYIEAFVSRLCTSENILGIILFGSVARNNFSQFSDIDTLIVSNLSFLRSLDLVEKTVDGLEPLRKDFLVSKGNFLNISPLILAPPDLKELHPIYFDIAEQGIILFERSRIITKFISRIKKIKHERNDERDMIQWIE